VGEPWLLPIIALVILASLYQFCQESAKTDDYFFLGFPSYWNILIVYLYWVDAASWINVAVLLFFIILSFAPIKFLYPSRTRHFPISSVIIGSIGGLMILYLCFFRWNDPPQMILIAIAVDFLLYVILSLIAHKRSLNK
jgi:phosphatidylserine synthase